MPDDIVQRLLTQATRVETPCGDGAMVWHQWPASSDGASASDRPPVVLFHGGRGNWVRNIDALRAAGRDVWAADLPGFGDSARPSTGGDADALIEPLAVGLAMLLARDAPGADAPALLPCDLVGFSFGGMTAGMLLAAHPQLARRLVLVGAPAMGVVPSRQFELTAWRHLPDAQAQDAVHRDNLAALMLHDRAQIDGLALQLHRANLARDRMPRRRLAHTDILARSLPHVTCPVHAIYGEHDALYKQWINQLAAAFAAVTPDFRGFTLIPDAGHWVQFEPAAFDAALLSALGGGGATP